VTEGIGAHAPTRQHLQNRTGEAWPEPGRRDNADGHLKRQVMGQDVLVAITDGRLGFGPWEQMFYGESDGGRQKRLLVKIIGEEKPRARPS
jgi:thiamine phosphate synthase YjbQ (UPF0047 family)